MLREGLACSDIALRVTALLCLLREGIRMVGCYSKVRDI